MTIYVVPVSGGKDSQCVLSKTVKKHGPENVVAVHHYTGIDHPVTMEHMDWMQGHYGVRIEHTANRKYKDMWELLDKRNAIPSRVGRFCTDELKIQAFNQWLDARDDLADLIVLLGMRAGESAPRAEKYSGFEEDELFSLRDLNPKRVPVRLAVVRVGLPIVNMSTNEVFDYLKAHGEKVNPLYAKGHARVGCYPCILAGKRDYRLAARDPIGRETIVTLANFKDLLVKAKKIDKPEMLIEHDLDDILAHANNDPFGFYAEDDDAGAGCQWCAM